MQRLLVLNILTSARRIFSNGGLSNPATACIDKLPHSTELGLSVWSQNALPEYPAELFFTGDFMNKVFTAFIACCVAVCSLSGCNGKKEDSNSQDNSSITEVMIPLEMPDIQISIPEDYQETSTDRNEKVYIKNDASIIVNSDSFTENYKTLDEYISFAEKTFKQYSDDFELLDRQERNNGKIIEYIYCLYTENGTFSKYCMTSFFTDGKQIYLITCKADSDKYQNYRDEFLGVTDSINCNQISPD